MQKAFTLIELIIVVSIIALIVAIAIPVFRRASQNSLPYNPKSDQQILEEAHARVQPAEKPIRIQNPPPKDSRFVFESNGVSPNGKPIFIVKDKKTNQQYLMVGETGMIEIRE